MKFLKSRYHSTSAIVRPGNNPIVSRGEYRPGNNRIGNLDFVIGGAGKPSITFSSANGIVTSDGLGNTIITFLSDDVLLASAPFTADVLYPAGGGGGGTGGAGGAGQVLEALGVSFGVQTAIKVGLGALGSTGSLASNPGKPTSVQPISGQLNSTGGSAVAIINASAPTTASGSGGGTASSSSGGPYSGGPGAQQPGTNAGGGNGGIVASPFAGGGSGGAGGPGGSVTAAGHGGNAGLGVSNSITGTAVIYGAGAPGIGFSNGGVGSTPGTPAPGGAVATNGANGGQGIDGTGGGGAAAFSANTGGRGGNGAVILRLRGTAGAVAPSASPVTIDQTNLAAYYGVIRLSTWNGNCLQITRASDSTTLNIGFVNNIADWRSADVFAAGTTILVSTIYDQSGNGKDLTPSVTAGAPTNVGVGFSGLNTWFGIRPITFQGVANTAFQFAKNTTFALNSNALSVYQVAIPHNGRDFQGYYQLSANTGFTTVDIGLYHTVTQLTATYDAHNTTLGYERSTLGTMSASYSGTAGAIWRINGVQTTSATNASNVSLVGLQIGSTTTPAASGTFEFFSMAVYAQADTSAQMITKEAALTTSLNMQTTFSNRIVFGGSSLWGYDSTLGQTPAWQAGWGKSTLGLVPSWEPIIIGIGGQTVAAECTQGATFDALFDATKTVNWLISDAPSNDIINGTYTSPTDAQNQMATLFNGTFLPFHIARHATGFKTAAPECIARGAFNANQEAARVAWNALLNANAAANNITVIPLASFMLGGTSPIFNSVAEADDTTYYFTGGTHLNNLGYWYKGSIERKAVVGF